MNLKEVVKEFGYARTAAFVITLIIMAFVLWDFNNNLEYIKKQAMESGNADFLASVRNGTLVCVPQANITAAMRPYFGGCSRNSTDKFCQFMGYYG